MRPLAERAIELDREEPLVVSPTLEAHVAASPLDARAVVRNVLAHLGPDFTLFILCATALGVVGQLFGAHYVLRLSTFLLPGLVVPGLVIVHFLRRPMAILHDQPGARAVFWRESRASLRDWVPLVLVAVTFDNLENYTGLVRKTTIDTSLYNIDVWLFGVEPTVWIKRFYHPLVTDWMATCYAVFLIVPMFLAIVASLRGRRDDFREIANGVMLEMWIAFFVFICLPAGPPRYYQPLLHGPFSTPLPSWLGLQTAFQAKWDTYSPLLVRASFPSLHCAYGMLTLICAWRLGSAVFPRRPRLFFWIVLPVELSLFVSTVYLRHHWIPDCVAGMTLGVVACTLARLLRRHWPRLRPAEPRLLRA